MKYTSYTKRVHCNVRIALFPVRTDLKYSQTEALPQARIAMIKPPTNLSKLSSSGSRGLVVESGSTVFCSCMTSLLPAEAVVLLPPLGSGLASCDSRC